MKTIEFEQLIGNEAIFCGIDHNKFRIGDLTLEAIEDEDDGYRSSLQELRIVDNINILFKEKVTIISTDIGIALKGVHGIILEIGTDNEDNYYPYFVFNYTPEKLTDNVSIKDIITKISE